MQHTACVLRKVNTAQSSSNEIEKTTQGRRYEVFELEEEDEKK